MKFRFPRWLIIAAIVAVVLLIALLNVLLFRWGGRSSMSRWDGFSWD